MNDRHARLVAAAELTRRWVHAQRASWSADGRSRPVEQRPVLVAPGFDPFAPPPTLSEPVAVAIAAPTFALASASGLAASDAVAVHGEPEAAKVPWSTRAADLASRLRRALVAPAHWRAAVAAACLAAAVVATPVYWSTWKKQIARQVGAGQHALARGRRTLATQVAARATAPTAKAKDERATSAPARGQLHVESEPPGAQVLVDGRERGETPVDVTDLSPGTHTVRLRTETGVIDRSVRIVAGETAQLSEAIYSGWLHVSAPFEIDVAEGAKHFTLDDRSQVLLPPGSHELTFENRALGFKEVQRVSIRPGGTTPVTLEPPPSLLSVTANEPAEVMVDGEAVGPTPVTDAPTRIGTRDITVTAASGAVRRLTITLTTEPAQIDVDFTSP